MEHRNLYVFSADFPGCPGFLGGIIDARHENWRVCCGLWQLGSSARAEIGGVSTHQEMGQSWRTRGPQMFKMLTWFDHKGVFILAGEFQCFQNLVGQTNVFAGEWTMTLICVQYEPPRWIPNLPLLNHVEPHLSEHPCLNESNHLCTIEYANHICPCFLHPYDMISGEPTNRLNYYLLYLLFHHQNWWHASNNQS